MNWKYGVVALAILIAAGIAFSTAGSAEEADFDTATVHLSPSCGCCVQHAQYLERAGVEVEVIEHTPGELNQLFDEHGVPEDYRACHITETEGQTVAGHVPVDIFNEIVEEQPDADVVTLPGMPQGSPGMPGNKNQEWIFYEILNGEVEGEFSTL